MGLHRVQGDFFDPLDSGKRDHRLHGGDVVFKPVEEPGSHLTFSINDSDIDELKFTAFVDDSKKRLYIYSSYSKEFWLECEIVYVQNDGWRVPVPKDHINMFIIQVDNWISWIMSMVAEDYAAYCLDFTRNPFLTPYTQTGGHEVTL